MSYQEKSNYISLITSLVISVPYIIYVFLRHQAESFNTLDELSFWASVFLVLIPIRIVAEIVMHIINAIVVAITTQKEESNLTDERDQLIELKGNRNSYYTFIIGIMLSMVSMVIWKSPAVMFSVMFFAGFLAEIVDNASQIYYYRKGI